MRRDHQVAGPWLGDLVAGFGGLERAPALAGSRDAQRVVVAGCGVMDVCDAPVAVRRVPPRLPDNGGAVVCGRADVRSHRTHKVRSDDLVDRPAAVAWNQVVVLDLRVFDVVTNLGPGVRRSAALPRGVEDGHCRAIGSVAPVPVCTGLASNRLVSVENPP